MTNFIHMIVADSPPETWGLPLRYTNGKQLVCGHGLPSPAPWRCNGCWGDVGPGEVAVKELGYHWASCGAVGGLNFHWKTLMAPQSVIDYIVVHELFHLRFRDHSDAFWNEVDKVLPRYREGMA